MFGKKKVIKQHESKPTIQDDAKVCKLYKGGPNKYGTYVLESFWLCKYDEYFQLDNEGMKFSIESVQWNGENIVSRTISTTETLSSGKNKKTGRLLGAAIGSVIAPGVGTIIGAMHGTGNEKVNQNSASSTITYEKEREEASDILIEAKDINSGSVTLLEYKCYANDAKLILGIIGDDESHDIDKIDVHKNPYEELKKVKELLDMGIITQEEFELKKKQLLEI